MLAELKPKTFLNRGGTHFVPGADAPHVYVCALLLCCFHGLINTRIFRRVLTALVNSCVEIKSSPSMVSPILAEFGGKCMKAMLRVCRRPSGQCLGPSKLLLFGRKWLKKNKTAKENTDILV